jgi:hypothetical protein
MGIRIHDLTISGFNNGIWTTTPIGTAPVGASPTATGVSWGYADLRVNNINVQNGGAYGIRFEPELTQIANSTWFYQGVYLGNSQIRNVYGNLDEGGSTGDGIGAGGRITACKGALIENLVIEDCGAKNGNTVGGPVGYYTVTSDSITLRGLQVARQHTGTGSTGGDGGGLDFDLGSTNCLAENCVVRDCDGYAWMNFQTGGPTNTSNTFRNCISVNNCRGPGGTRTNIIDGNVVTRNESCTFYQDEAVTGSFVNICGVNGSTFTNCNFILIPNNHFWVDSSSTLLNNNYWFGIGNFNFKWDGSALASLAAVQAVAEKVNGNSTGYNFDPGFTPPVANGSCADILAAWMPQMTGTLKTGGITPQTVGSGIV